MFCSFISFAQDYLPKTLIVKAKESYRSYFSTGSTDDPRIEGVFSIAGVTKVGKEYPGSTRPEKQFHDNGIAFTDLSRTYRIEYSKEIDPKDLIGKFMGTGAFEYVEVSNIHQPMFKPNDAEIDSLYYLELMNLYAAWDSTKGDTNVVIGISDTGFDIDHPDFVDNVKYNYADPIDGVDNDGDGYIDNFRGWDLADNDNNPQVGGNWHGIYVASFAGATADNSLQFAGTGFRCKIVPLKIESGGFLTAGPLSIYYAATHGFDVVNCSWGSPNSYTQNEQDLMKFATIDNNCLVVASAGNNHTTERWYPAAYDWVLSVGGTDPTGKEKWLMDPTTGSVYNDHVDVMAPAEQLYALNNGGGTLGGRLGTSMSAPMAAGIAGLVKSRFPSWTALQVLEQMKSTCTFMDTVAFNAPYAGKIGKGLLNADAAVNDLTNPGLIFDAATFTDGADELYHAGDTVSLYGTVFNILVGSSAATRYRVTTESPYVEFIDSLHNLIAIPFNSNVNTISVPFRFRIKDDIPENEQVWFKVFVEDGDYYNWRNVSVILNPDYVNVKENNLEFSIASSGKIGFNGANGSQDIGVGINYKENGNVLFQMGVMASLDGTKTSFVLDEDFEKTSDLIEANAMEADKVVYTNYNDDPAGANKIGIDVKQKTMVWKAADRSDFIILEMNIINTSGSDINGLNFGIYSDWDITNANLNTAVFDSSITTGYTAFAGGTHAGVHILSDSSFQHYAVTNDGSAGAINVYDGFSSAEQYLSISGGDAFNSAGPKDVAQTVGVGGLNILAGDSVKVAFAIVAGDDAAGITSASLEADTAYDELYKLNTEIVYIDSASCYGVCDGEAAVWARGGVGTLSYDWFDLAGTPTTDSVNAVCAGTYHVEISDLSGLKDTLEVVVESPDQLVLDLGSDTSICNYDSISIDAGAGYSYVWSPGGETSQVLSDVKSANTYKVVITDGSGCSDSDEVVLSVVVPATVDLGVDTSFCDLDSLVLDAGPGFTYSWDDLSINQTRTVRVSGDYEVTITDVNGCVDSDEVSVTVLPLPVVDLGIDTFACNGDSVLIDAGVFLGYSWLPNSEETQTIFAKESDDYSVEVTGANGCVASDTVQVDFSSGPTVSFADTAMSDGASCDGTVLGVIDIVDAPLSSISWSDDAGRDSLKAVDLCAGSYTLIATDSYGCVDSATVEIIDVESVSSVGGDFKIYPNPSNGFVTIEGAEINDVQIFNSVGGLVYKSNISGGIINLSQFAEGSYLMVVSTDEGQVTKQLLIKK